VSFRSTQSLPGPLSMEIEGLHLGPEEEDAYFEVFHALTAEDRHQLLGHPDAVQGEMTEQCELVNHGKPRALCGGREWLERPEGG